VGGGGQEAAHTQKAWHREAMVRRKRRQKLWGYQEVQQNTEKGAGEEPFWWPENKLSRKNMNFKLAVHIAMKNCIWKYNCSFNYMHCLNFYLRRGEISL